MPARPAARRNRRSPAAPRPSAAFIAPNSTRRCARILRCIGDAEPLAHRVVDLRRVEPHMRVRERQPVRHQPCARHAKRQPRIVVGRRGERLREQRQQRLRARSARPRAGPPAPARRRRRAADRARPDRASSCAPTASSAAAMRAASGSVAGSAATCAMQPRKLQALHLQPQPQRVPPADVGATVGVVADPARQDHRPRVELGPAIRPGAARDRQQRRVEPVDGVAAIARWRPRPGRTRSPA